MKKIGFLSSLAAVALMSMTLVGCEKEKIDINGSINGSEVVIPSTNAKVVVAYTVQDAATGNEVAGAKIYVDGVAIRRCAIENNVTTFTSLDTVKVLLDVLEEQTISVAEIF